MHSQWSEKRMHRSKVFWCCLTGMVKSSLILRNQVTQVKGIWKVFNIQSNRSHWIPSWNSFEWRKKVKNKRNNNSTREKNINKNFAIFEFIVLCVNQHWTGKKSQPKKTTLTHYPQIYYWLLVQTIWHMDKYRRRKQQQQWNRNANHYERNSRTISFEIRSFGQVYFTHLVNCIQDFTHELTFVLVLFAYILRLRFIVSFSRHFTTAS